MGDATDAVGLSRADATRARLLKAATDAFAEKGFHATTTRDIATLAGMSPAAPYVHHKSKEELLYLISRTGHDRVLQLVRAAVAPSDDPVEAVRRLMHDFAVDHAMEHTGARIVNYELTALSPSTSRRSEASGSRSTRPWTHSSSAARRSARSASPTHG